jgi:hypothetical protein
MHLRQQARSLFDALLESADRETLLMLVPPSRLSWSGSIVRLLALDSGSSVAFLVHTP